MQKIDRSSWPREEIYRFFSAVSDPFYMLTYTADVTELVTFCRREKLSFYYSLVYLCTEAVNRVENFRYVIRGEDVFLLDWREPSITDLSPGSDLFHILTLPCGGEDLRSFCARAEEKNRSQTGFIDMSAEGENLIYLSCVPWVKMTGLTNERHRADPRVAEDSIPRIAWGRYEERDGRYTLGISLEVNHRLIDGIHIGKFAQALEESIRALGE